MQTDNPLALQNRMYLCVQPPVVSIISERDLIPTSLKSVEVPNGLLGGTNTLYSLTTYNFLCLHVDRSTSGTVVGCTDA
jgi:hypothetical protein